ncbi:hypothetical protein C806_00718 [Lachnospiraceae bacterium 3-1]|nr:hypothetical protein C806_00718 [Lachnospiraceae bacterium 3-1]
MQQPYLFFYRKDLATLKRESIFPIEEQSSYRTAAGMKSVAKRPAAGGESCKAGFFLATSNEPSSRARGDRSFAIVYVSGKGIKVV